MKDFEAWEGYADFHDRQDWPGLVAYCEEEVAEEPDDLHAAERLADAYLLTGDYEKAIKFTSQIHYECPEIPAFQHRILDALFALGKTEHDFDWSQQPTVMRLGPAVLDICHDFLRPKRKSRPLHDVRWVLEERAYLVFSDDELLACLRNDSRFVIDGCDTWNAEISVRRKAKSRTND